jgi:hypothetical protein
MKIKTTGNLRELLADTISEVKTGKCSVEKANTVHKLAKNISDSLYSETKIRMFEQEVGDTATVMGEMPLGSQTVNKTNNVK